VIFGALLKSIMLNFWNIIASCLTYPSHRTGRLCSQCVEGYSVAINSPTFACEECKNDYNLGILYLFLSYFIPVSTLLWHMILK